MITIKEEKILPDINDLIDVFVPKSGKVKIEKKEANIYKLLRNRGFCRTKLDNKIIYYHRENGEIKPINKMGIIDAFDNFLQSGEFTNLPNEVSGEDLLNWFYGTQPIKENDLFNKYLNEPLNETEVHQYRLQAFPAYRKKFIAQ